VKNRELILGHTHLEVNSDARRERLCRRRQLAEVRGKDVGVLLLRHEGAEGSLQLLAGVRARLLVEGLMKPIEGETIVNPVALNKV